MRTYEALTSGLRSTNRSFRMIALLYAINFFVAGILAWGFHSVIASAFDGSMSLERLVKNFDYTVYADFGTKFQGNVNAITSQVMWLVLFYFLLSTLLGGGTITTLKNQDEQFTMRSFFDNCGAYFFRFLRLLLIFTVVLVLVVIVSAIIFGGIHSALTDNAVSEVWPITLGIILFLSCLFLVMMVVMIADYAKVATVANDASSMLRTSWQAVKFVFRHFFSTVVLQLSILVFLLIGIAAYLLLEKQIGMATPFTILIMFLIQQASVGFKVWIRVLTFGSEFELLKAMGAEQEIAVPEGSQPTTLVPERTMGTSVPVATAVHEPKRRAPRRPVVKKTTTRRKQASRKSK